MSESVVPKTPTLLDFPPAAPRLPLDAEKIPVRVGVIGCGYWGPKLIRNFTRSSGCEVTAVADCSPEQLARIGEAYPHIPGTTDYKALLADPDIEAVAVATPVATHFAIARDALRAGKHVLVEKPLATSFREAAALVDLAERNDCLLMVDHTYLFTGAVEKMRELVVSGELGEILYFDSTRINLGLFQHDVNVVWDLAPHDLSILLHVLDKKPVAVSALGAAHAGTAKENLAYITLTFDDNTLAHFHVNWLAPRKVRQIIIGGERKMLVFDDMESNEKIKVYDKGITVEQDDREAVYQSLFHYRVGDMWAPRLDPTEALLKECSHISHCIRHGVRPVNNGYLALEVVRLLEAAELSMRRRGELVDVI
ncbi:MAG: Gfo/Idh/MocA family oxidoreductase [Thiogranum sp.]